MEKGISGKVIITFSVNSHGKVVDVEVIENPNYYLSSEAVRVISNSPEWEPALQEGKPVKQNFTMPVIFNLE